ncbi:hypothetical protein CHARACLAT_006300 [Characodon lateralis]|uniref:Uncharacterized protein n=1 Tax=Characodon lateralis TaxID=208331 RepID=A0ABU7CYZ2_9TELE|nr:hypothetical protein [Characodon lateralis]
MKGKMYKTVVRLAMLNGLEIVALRKRQETELKEAEMKTLRFSLGLTRMDRIMNEYIRGIAQVRCVGDKARGGDNAALSLMFSTGFRRFNKRRFPGMYDSCFSL